VNVFHGRAEQEHLQVGNEQLRHHNDSYGHGKDVFAFARPHELKIVDNNHHEGVSARISRVLSFGIETKVELDGLNGTHYEVHLSQQQRQAQSLYIGQEVKLVPSALALFPRELETSAQAQRLSEQQG
jgi:sulfate/thiosulfate transport system ATP-binding protein